VTGFKGVGKQATVVEHHVWSSVIQLLYLGHEMHVFKQRDIPRVDVMEMLVTKEPDDMTLVMESNEQCSSCTAGFIMLGRETDGAEVTGLQSNPFCRNSPSNRELSPIDCCVISSIVYSSERLVIRIVGPAVNGESKYSITRCNDGSIDQRSIKAAMEGVNAVQDQRRYS
jgi:hypothetical protein